MKHISLPDFSTKITSILTVLVILISGSVKGELTSYTPFQFKKMINNSEAEAFVISLKSFSLLDAPLNRKINIDFPISPFSSLKMNLTKFSLFSSQSQFLIGSASGDIPLQSPSVSFFSGSIENEPGSFVYLSISNDNQTFGYISRANGAILTIASQKEDGLLTDNIVVSEATSFSDIANDIEFCGITFDESALPLSGSQTTQSPTNKLGATRLVNMAIDADQKFYNIFGNLTATTTYIAQLIGAVSSVYYRDNNIRIQLVFTRVWANGGEPFNTGSLNSFSKHWNDVENTTNIHIVHLLSGRRDLSFGGIAQLAGTCGNAPAYGIDGYLNGSFPSNLIETSLGIWDVNVICHEMGHNFLTLHTHDGYSPPIDDCAGGEMVRSTIMSYCHIHPGYTTNLDLRFHRRVQNVIENAMIAANCNVFDCNGNSIDDALDISSNSSDDVNNNGIPDECEDCNSNDTLDYLDILNNGYADMDANGILDVCEADCNNNLIPDDFEIDNLLTADVNGNYIPDECEADCNLNFIPDFTDIKNGNVADLDRNRIPDICQDCNNNLITDWIDLERQDNIYVADQVGDYLREYHGRAGVPIRNYARTKLDNPMGVLIGPDRAVYVSSHGNDKIIRIDLNSGTDSEFVPAGSGGLNGPTSAVFDINGDLLVASQLNSSIIKYDGNTGAHISTFVNSGSGGLSFPYDITFGPNGNLFVTSLSNEIIEYDGSNGTLIGTFVAANSGGLSSPRGLVFKPDGNLLVTSYNSGQVLEYDGSSGAFIKQYNDELTLDGPWGIAVGPNGNVYVARTLGTVRLIEYDYLSGRYYRARIRGDLDLFSPTDFAFMPPSSLDCNRNGQLDECDISLGSSLDANNNNIPDECETGDSDGDGISDVLDNCINVSNPLQTDSDNDGFGNLCDNCPSVQNVSQTDSDSDGLGDDCDNCPNNANSSQFDMDNDGIGFACDDCIDVDGDGFGTDAFMQNTCPVDNCLTISNPDQLDSDNDGVGDVCDSCPLDPDNDADLDGFCADLDNCPTVSNPDQTDTDNDNVGDACCCTIRGDFTHDGMLNIVDLTNFVNFMFKAGAEPGCPDEANINGTDGMNIADLTALVSYFFKNGSAPADCASVK